MARKKKEEEPVIKNEYAISYNGELLKAVFTPHKKTKTYKIYHLKEASLVIRNMNDQLSAWKQRGSGRTSWLENRVETSIANTKTLTFVNEVTAKLWLVAHSSYPGSKDAAWFFTEQELNRIINKHKYDFRRGFTLDSNKTRPLLCEFEVVKLDNVN